MAIRGFTRAGALALLAAAGGCGGGTLSFIGASRGGEGTPDTPPLLGGLAIVEPRRSPALLQFTAQDAQGDPLDVRLRWRDPTSGALVDALLLDDPAQGIDAALNGLAAEAGGTLHSKLWDVAGQLGAGYVEGIELEVRALGGTGAGAATIGRFDLGNDAPQVSSVRLGASGEVAGNVPVDFDLADSSDDVVTVVAEFLRVDLPVGDPLAGVWQPAHAAAVDGSSGDGALVGLVAPRGGKTVTFFWDTLRDLGAAQADVRLRFHADDGVAIGATVESGDFRVDNNSEPIAFLDGAAFAADPDQRGRLPLRFEVADGEGDRVDVVVQWTAAGSPFPTLPATPAELRAALADPTQRRLLQIAEERRSELRGFARAASDAFALELDLAAEGFAALTALGGPVGRELELLGRSDAFELASVRWPALLPLLADPVAVATFAEGDRAALLRHDAATGWAIEEFDLATGRALRTLAHGSAGSSGVPTAFALEAGQRHALVASDVGGALLLERADFADGSATRLHGPSALATPARALLAWDAGRALLVAGDALHAVSLLDPAAPLVVLKAGLAEPSGLARDPSLPDSLLVSERTFLGAGGRLGRLLRVDVTTGITSPLALQSGSLERPGALAYEPRSRTLLCCTDLQGDGAFELQSLALGGPDVGVARVVASGLAVAPASLALGDAGLRLAALPGHGDLVAVGGIAQRRTIVAFEPAAQRAYVATATDGTPFDPPPAPCAPWRLVERATPLRAAEEGTTGLFRWERDAVVQEGGVLLRLVPFDDEYGSGQEVTTPRTVRATVEVAARSFSSTALADRPVALARGDLDGDGDLDLAVASELSDSVRLLRKAAGASFVADALPLGGPAGTPRPSAVALADFDGDGRLDVACASRGNGGSGSVALFFQAGNGTFPTVPSLVVTAAIANPADLLVADLDRDGALDLAVANGGSDDVALLYGEAGGFASAKNRVVGGGGTTHDPVALAAADIDGDGRLDLAVANGSGDDVALFVQAAGGGFATAPTAQLLAALDAPRDLVALDADADGDADLAVTSRDTSEVVLFRQVAPLQFVAQAHGRLFTSGAPTALIAADVDRDGDDDLVAASELFGTLLVFAQKPDGTFGQGGDRDPDLVLALSSGASEPAALLAADLDGDGALDLLAAEAGSDTLTWFATQRAVPFAATPERTLVPPRIFGNPAAPLIADLDGDGDRDVAALLANDALVPHLFVWLQSSPGLFPNAPDFILGGVGLTDVPKALAAADLDDDGDLDLAVTAQVDRDGSGPVDEAIVALFFNDGGAPPRFAAAPDVELSLGVAQSPGVVGADPLAIVAADLDGDGAQDLAVADAGNKRIAWFRQVGPAAFAPPSFLTAGISQPSGLAAGDVDGDGRVDLALADASLLLFFGAVGGPESAPSVTLANGSVRPEAVALADLDGDGRLDLAAPSKNRDRLVVWRQDRAPAPPRGFAARQEIGTDGSLKKPVAIAIGDADDDGDLDLLCANGDPSQPTLALFLQRGGGSFAVAPDQLLRDSATAPSLPATATLADVDGDGELDAVGCFSTPGFGLSIWFGGGR
ncbi:MAG: VCBS repeat-containing protein [Planctomycetes bacterium]|nr:VCBS repeat-containing protein [Planctomycetota bacterium]